LEQHVDFMAIFAPASQQGVLAITDVAAQQVPPGAQQQLGQPVQTPESQQPQPSAQQGQQASTAAAR
jgi:hypothetical protein